MNSVDAADSQYGATPPLILAVLDQPNDGSPAGPEFVRMLLGNPYNADPDVRGEYGKWRAYSLPLPFRSHRLTNPASSQDRRPWSTPRRTAEATSSRS